MKKGKTPEALAKMLSDEDRRARREAQMIDQGYFLGERQRLARKRKEEERLLAYRKRRGQTNIYYRSNAGRMPLPRPGWLILWERMQPGAWYAWEDLVRLMPEYARGSLRAWPWTKLLPLGMVERVVKPEGEPGIRPQQEYWFRRIEGALVGGEFQRSEKIGAA